VWVATDAYLAIVMDQYSRRILAWTLTRQRTAAFTCAVLARAARALGARSCATVARLGLRQSASVRGPGDNAHAESFFCSLKAEIIRGEHFATDHALADGLARCIRYYNTVRLHAGLNYQSPLAFVHSVA
jgi:transposase InsO family protein